jgi:hypothetical protein
MKAVRVAAVLYFWAIVALLIVCQEAPPTVDPTPSVLLPDTVVVPGGKFVVALDAWIVLLSDLTPDSSVSDTLVYQGYEQKGDSLVTGDPFLRGYLVRPKDFGFGIVELKLIPGATFPDSGRYSVIIRRMDGQE